MRAVVPQAGVVWELCDQLVEVPDIGEVLVLEWRGVVRAGTSGEFGGFEGGDDAAFARADEGVSCRVGDVRIAG